MTRNDIANLPGKHPDHKINSDIAEQIKAFVSSGKLACKAAVKIAETLGVEPMDVGKTCDLLDIKLTRCQLGLFGHAGRKHDTDSQVISKLKPILQEKEANGRIACKDCWDIADTAAVSYGETGQVCDALGIKIIGCQLGAF